MSNDQTAARHSALTLAVQFCNTHQFDGDGRSLDVLGIAETYLDFLNGADKQDSASKPVAATKPAAAVKPAVAATSVKKPAEATAPVAKPVVAEDPAKIMKANKEQVGEYVAKALAANLRSEILALMMEIGGPEAKSVTSFLAAAPDLGKFYAKADELLMAA